MSDPDGGPPPKTSTVTTGGGSGGNPPSYPKDNVVRNFAQLKALIPDYEGRPLNDILTSPLFSGAGAYQFEPSFFQQLQSGMLQLEQASGIPLAQLGSTAPLSDLMTVLEKGGFVGGKPGGGGGRGASMVGAQAPDPYAAGKLALEQYAMLIETGQIPFEQGMKQWQAEFDKLIAGANIEGQNVSNKLAADTSSAGLTRDYAQMEQERAANIASAQQNLRDTATQRANVFASQILPSALPTGYQLNLGMGGLVPENRVDVDAMFNQGLPSLADSYGGLDTLFPTVGPAPQVTAGQIGMPNWGALPEVPRTVLPPMPNIDPYIQQAAAGTPGWIV